MSQEKWTPVWNEIGIENCPIVTKWITQDGHNSIDIEFKGALIQLNLDEKTFAVFEIGRG